MDEWVDGWPGSGRMTGCRDGWMDWFKFGLDFVGSSLD